MAQQIISQRPWTTRAGVTVLVLLGVAIWLVAMMGSLALFTENQPCPMCRYNNAP